MVKKFTWTKELELKLIEIAEDIILKSRWILFPFYVVSIAYIPFIFWDLCMVMIEKSKDEQLIEHALLLFDMLDITMIANLAWLVPAGSFFVFVDDNYPDLTLKKRPRCLTHISAGILKEKYAGSVAGIMLLYMLKGFLKSVTTHEHINLEITCVQGGIFILALAALLVFNITNAADHHDHSKEASTPQTRKSETTHTKEEGEHHHDETLA